MARLWQRRDGPTTPGALPTVTADGEVVEMPLRHTRVAVEVSAFLATTTVAHTFENPFDEPVQCVCTCVFPLVVAERYLPGG